MAGEKLWRLPLYDDYMHKIESLTADLANTGGNRFGGVGVSAMFLKQFAEGYPWAHVDIAPMSFEERPSTPKRPPFLQKGGTGFGIAGRGIARAESMAAALQTAWELG